MKNRIKTIAMLMSMIIGTLTVSAQSARRGSSEQKRTTSSSKTYKRPTQKSNSSVARNAQTNRKASTAKRSNTQHRNQAANVQGASSNQRGNTVQAPRTAQAQRGKAIQTQRKSNSNRGSAAYTTQRPPKQQVTTQRNPNANLRNTTYNPKTAPKQQASAQRSNTQRMSTTSRNNPKSTYRAPNKTVHVGKTFSDPKSTHRQGNGQAGSKHYNETHFTKHTKAHHRHHYYPAKKVKIHIHPMTYRGNYRALYYPRYSEIVWSRSMHRHYVGLYPNYSGWHYSWGYRIQTMSVFDAAFNVGEIARVYGRVYATWYNQETDDLLLFFGGEYPGQAFTMVIPGNVARRYSWRPERYFLGQHVSATGLITMFDGKAEIVLKRRSQLNVY